MLRSSPPTLIRRGLLATGLLSLSLAAGLAPAQTKENFLMLDKPGLEKVTSDILQARRDIKRNNRAVLDSLSSYAPYAMRGEKVQCTVGLTEITSDFFAFCKKNGITLVDTLENGYVSIVTVQCSSIDQIEALAAREDVISVRSEAPVIANAGLATNDADATMNADTARSTFSVDGTGIRIGVLSDSMFNQRLGSGTASGPEPADYTGTTDQLSSDLPASLRVVQDLGSGGSDEGNGMAQLIHDVAPGADISFATAFGGITGFANNITRLAGADGLNCDIIVDDVTNFAELVYQNGPIAIAYNNAVASGVAAFSSAGNNADNAHEESYTDVNPGSDDTTTFPPSTGVDLHDFGAAKGGSSDTHLAVSVGAGRTLTVALQWDEPGAGTLGAGSGSEADYDLFLLSNTNPPTNGVNIIAVSADRQGVSGSPSGEPIELIQVTNNGGTAATVQIVVDHFRGIDSSLVYLYMNGGTIVDTSLIGDSTIYGHPLSPDVMAVGAVFFCEYDSGGIFLPNGSLIEPESFTSKGGDRPLYFDDAGTRIGSPASNMKPNFTAPDGGDTTFFGQALDLGGTCGEPESPTAFPNFFGTSAAAPNAAAVAALMLEHDPSLTPAQIYSTLASTVQHDFFSDGFDDLTGEGLIDANAALAALIPATATPSPTPSPTQSPTPSPTMSPTPSPTATPSPTQSPTPSPTQSPTPSPSPSPTPTPSPTATPSPTQSPTPSPTESPTPSPTQSPTPSPTQSPTPSPTASPTPSPTQSPTPSPTATPSPTQSPTPSPTESPTPSPTQSPTPSPTQSPTPSPTQSPTPSPSPSPTESPTPTPVSNVEQWEIM